MECDKLCQKCLIRCDSYNNKNPGVFHNDKLCIRCYLDYISIKQILGPDSDSENKIDKDDTCDNDDCLLNPKDQKLQKVGNFYFCNDCVFAMARYVARNGI
jgi:hypothetical protein